MLEPLLGRCWCEHDEDLKNYGQSCNRKPRNRRPTRDWQITSAFHANHHLFAGSVPSLGPYYQAANSLNGRLRRLLHRLPCWVIPYSAVFTSEFPNSLAYTRSPVQLSIRTSDFKHRMQPSPKTHHRHGNMGSINEPLCILGETDVLVVEADTPITISL